VNNRGERRRRTEKVITRRVRTRSQHGDRTNEPHRQHRTLVGFGYCANPHCRLCAIMHDECHRAKKASRRDARTQVDTGTVDWMDREWAERFAQGEP
jgi:hypothetical protein